MDYDFQKLLCTKPHWSLLLALGVEESRWAMFGPIIKGMALKTQSDKAPFPAVNYFPVQLALE